MRLATESSIFNTAMCIAAFGFIVLIVILAHPASQSSSVMATAANVAIGNEATSASLTPLGASLLRRSASE